MGNILVDSDTLHNIQLPRFFTDRSYSQFSILGVEDISLNAVHMYSFGCLLKDILVHADDMSQKIFGKIAEKMTHFNSKLRPNTTELRSFLQSLKLSNPEEDPLEKAET
eukprot:TRINITY_DN10553_c0_g2_i2.p1 TRINITY_DN10553_c0_g2~~TRINITY_DN10553_c0_g2_i2.p1  ORF type:complete len:109 (-),score=6.29 TRINITY_DN10553_c0_g2_i2:75-401(-)